MKFVDTERYEIDRLIELFDAIESALAFDPYALGEPHPDMPNCFVYSTPPVFHIPNVYIFYEIDAKAKIVQLWSAKFPD